MRAATMILGTAILGVASAAVLWGAPELAAGPDQANSAEKTARQPHPLYDDGGTLDWRTSVAEAMEITGARRRLIFIEWGRES